MSADRAGVEVACLAAGSLLVGVALIVIGEWLRRGEDHWSES